jgi:hypothetical protein
MSVHALSALTVMADSGPKHPGINPPLNGVVAFVFLLVLLFITTRLNRDR